MNQTDSTTDALVAEARDRLRGMALSLATGAGPLVDPKSFAAAIDAYGEAVRVAASAVVSPPTSRAAAAEWIDGHPQLEAIAAAVWERCEHHDSGLIIDDPRNIAVAAYAAVLSVLGEQTDRAADVERWQRKYVAEHARHVAVVGALVTDRVAVRAETLGEAETALRKQASRLTGEFNDSDILHEDGPAATVATWKRAADLLRRLAVEAHGTETQQQEPGIRGLLEHVGIDTTGRDITVDGKVVDAWPAPVVEQPAAATGYGDGKGRTYCLACAQQVGADVPLTADEVEHWELCPSCGRHVIDVAREREQQPAAPDAA